MQIINIIILTCWQRKPACIIRRHVSVWSVGSTDVLTDGTLSCNKLLLIIRRWWIQACCYHVLQIVGQDRASLAYIIHRYCINALSYHLLAALLYCQFRQSSRERYKLIVSISLTIYLRRISFQIQRCRYSCCECIGSQICTVDNQVASYIKVIVHLYIANRIVDSKIHTGDI